MRSLTALLVVVSACMSRTELSTGALVGDACVVNSDCPVTCIHNTCAPLANAGEACDDDLDCVDGLMCPASICASEACGNGTLDPGESCDDGPGEGEGSCLDDCSGIQMCGDGTENGDEVCDDGAANGDEWSEEPHCNSSCNGFAPHCGDGTFDSANENCDDGNALQNDGCDPTCYWETGWQCTTESPSRCFLPPRVDLRLVSPGTFSMGSPIGEIGRYSNEQQHDVTFTRAIWIQQTEVTQSAFESVMGWNPSHFGPNGSGADCGGNCPVENVSWFDMVAHANELSIDEGLAPCYTLTDVACEDSTSCSLPGECGAGQDCASSRCVESGGAYMNCMDPSRGGIDDATVTVSAASVYDCEGYRLPTEAEWEFAARAGDIRATYNGELTAFDCTQPNPTLDPIAWFCGNSAGTTHPVMGRAPNAWGLFDVLGNVTEWCWDWYEGDYPGSTTDPVGPTTGTRRVHRGISWRRSGTDGRAANRLAIEPGERQQLTNDPDMGARLVRTVF